MQLKPDVFKWMVYMLTNSLTVYMVHFKNLTETLFFFPFRMKQDDGDMKDPVVT